MNKTFKAGQLAFFYTLLFLVVSRVHLKNK